jgi:hypothetical protein
LYLPLEFGIVGEWFHVTGFTVNYTNKESTDMHLTLGEHSRNSAEAKQLYAERFLNCPTPSRDFKHRF